MTPLDPREERWARRLERERQARRQAERLAEQGMRELWLSNQTLEQRVQERTATVDRALVHSDLLARARQAVLAELGVELAAQLEQHAAPAQVEQLGEIIAAIVASASRPTAVAADRSECRLPSDVVDEIVQNWQTAAARRGLLLVAATDGLPGAVTACWVRLVAAVDAVLDAAVAQASPGPLHLLLDVSPATAVVTIDDAGPEANGDMIVHCADDVPSPHLWAALGQRGTGVAVAEQLTVGDVLSMRVAPSPLGGLRVVLSTPVGLA